MKFLIPAILLMIAVSWIEMQWFTPAKMTPFRPELAGEMTQWQIVDPPYHPQTAMMVDMDGVEMPISQLRGSWTLVNFWATWCPPCLVELPMLVELDAAFEGQGFEVLAVNMDSGMSRERLQGLIDKYEMARLGAYRSSGRSIHNAFEIRGLPTSVMIDPNGLMRGVFLGEADWTSRDARAFVSSVLTN